MKLIPILMVFTITSCALYKDFKETDFNWSGSGKPRLKKADTQLEPEATRPGQLVEDVLVASTKSQDERSSLMFYNTRAIMIELHDGKMSYKAGHSIELSLDGEPSMQEVEPTDRENVIRIKDPQVFAKKLQGKKVLVAELLLNETGAKKFQFPITEEVTKFLATSLESANF